MGQNASSLIFFWTNVSWYVRINQCSTHHEFPHSLSFPPIFPGGNWTVLQTNTLVIKKSIDSKNFSHSSTLDISSLSKTVFKEIYTVEKHGTMEREKIPSEASLSCEACQHREHPSFIWHYFGLQQQWTRLKVWLHMTMGRASFFVLFPWCFLRF